MLWILNKRRKWSVKVARREVRIEGDEQPINLINDELSDDIMGNSKGFDSIVESIESKRKYNNWNNADVEERITTTTNDKMADGIRETDNRTRNNRNVQQNISKELNKKRF